MPLHRPLTLHGTYCAYVKHIHVSPVSCTFISILSTEIPLFLWYRDPLKHNLFVMCGQQQHSYTRFKHIYSVYLYNVRFYLLSSLVVNNLSSCGYGDGTLYQACMCLVAYDATRLSLWWCHDCFVIGQFKYARTCLQTRHKEAVQEYVIINISYYKDLRWFTKLKGLN